MNDDRANSVQKHPRCMSCVARLHRLRFQSQNKRIPIQVNRRRLITKKVIRNTLYYIKTVKIITKILQSLLNLMFFFYFYLNADL